MSSTRKLFGLRIDVDTLKGLTHGVPQILDTLDDFKIRATFFITMGPDKTGRNLFHLPRRKGRNIKISPLQKYGLKQMLYGLLIPPPLMEQYEHIIKKICKKGHEVGLHGYNHYYWANYFQKMSFEETARLISKGVDCLEKIIGKKPCGFAAPAFKWSKNSLLLLNKLNFAYSSDVYGRTPFYPEIGGKKLDLLQIPVSEILIEDLVAQGVPDSQILAIFQKNLRKWNFITMYVHASYEFLYKNHLIRSILNEAQSDDSLSFLSFAEITKKLKGLSKIRKIA